MVCCTSTSYCVSFSTGTAWGPGQGEQEKEHGEDTIREFKLSISKLEDDLEVQRGLADSGKRELAESKVSER